MTDKYGFRRSLCDQRFENRVFSNYPHRRATYKFNIYMSHVVTLLQRSNVRFGTSGFHFLSHILWLLVTPSKLTFLLRPIVEIQAEIGPIKARRATRTKLAIMAIRAMRTILARRWCGSTSSHSPPTDSPISVSFSCSFLPDATLTSPRAPPARTSLKTSNSAAPLPPIR